MDLELRFMAAVLLILGLLLLGVTIWAIQGAQTQSMCIRNGYPQSYVSWNLEAYCIRVINQTQYVIPLANLK